MEQRVFHRRLANLFIASVAVPDHGTKVSCFYATFLKISHGLRRCSKGPVDDQESFRYVFDYASMTESVGV
jgi:hypothetical protein